MADRIKPEFIGKAPILSEGELRALMDNKPRPRFLPTPPRHYDEGPERLRKLLMKRRQNYKNGGAVMSGRGNNFKGVR